MYIFKVLILFVLIITSFEIVLGNPVHSNGDRELMLQILNERKEKFSTYTQSLDDATGIFGNKTKGDLKNSQKILVEIVKLDNKLIQLLNQKIDFKGFEKINSEYDNFKKESILNVLKEDLKRSDLRLGLLNQKIEDQNAKMNKLILTIIFLSSMFLLLVIKFLGKKRS